MDIRAILLTAQDIRNCTVRELLRGYLKLNVREAFGYDHPYSIPMTELLGRLDSWRNSTESYSKWVQYQARKQRLQQTEVSFIVNELHRGTMKIESSQQQFDLAYFQTLVRDLFRRHNEISEFEGATHSNLIERFRQLDKARMALARTEVAIAHYDRIPRTSSNGEMAIIRREIEKKKRHKSIRQLMKDAGTAIQSIAPVFMMSPLSVAQYLEPGTVTFDLLLVDEASQVSPVDAIGSIARARQIVVVGDDKQLPPTRFFSKMLDSSSDSQENDDFDAGDIESLLGLCSAQGMSQRMLRWHYRSRHHSLIAVSNREFYNDDLYIVPSPTTITATHGLHFRYIDCGVYDRGKTATNPIEALAVAEAVLYHARRYPQKSLGVGTFSVAQRDSIRKELEGLLVRNVDLADFFSPGRPDPFFVKNLENIQGDERDVIFISVGYARDSSGNMPMNFGPLSKQGGERRLNVLISRARERCDIFSSITHSDIDTDRSRSQGTVAFKNFLKYAATGKLESDPHATNEYDSDFERQVAASLRRNGFEVHSQVGTTGFVIDLAVVDPDRPGQYLIGIECDGATYHSSRWARDRDRLRETALRQRGWNLYRIWSTDWFQRPEEQLSKLIAMIRSAKSDADSDEAEELRSIDPIEDDAELLRDDTPENSDIEATSLSIPYLEANFEVENNTPVHQLPVEHLARIVEQVVKIEGPIHQDEVARRVTALWGLQRTGARISESINRALEFSSQSGKIEVKSGFASIISQTRIPVRNRSELQSPTLRKAEMIPPSEIQEAIRLIIDNNIGISRIQVTVMTARCLGFNSTGTKLRSITERVIDDAISTNLVILKDDKLYPPESVNYSIS